MVEDSFRYIFLLVGNALNKGISFKMTGPFTAFLDYLTNSLGTGLMLLWASGVNEYSPGARKSEQMTLRRKSCKTSPTRLLTVAISILRSASVLRWASTLGHESLKWSLR